MPPSAAAHHTPASVWRHPLTLGLGLAVALALAWDASGADLQVMRWIGSPTGFALRDNGWLVQVFHEDWRQMFLAFYLAMGIWAVWPARWNLPRLQAMSLPRRERVLLVLLVALSLLAINLVKVNSLTSCPWDLQLFGGHARYVSHWALGQSDGGPGRCFPGGHASSALAFLGLCLPWLSPPGGVPRNAATGWRWLLLLLIGGLIAGATQTLRGAHFPSHTLWTILICASVSWVGWRLALPWMASAEPVLPAVSDSQSGAA